MCKRLVALISFGSMLLLSSSVAVHAQPGWRTLAGVQAVSMTHDELSCTKGKATPALLQFLAQATQTQLGGGVVLYTLCPDGCAVTATWNTGTMSGMASVSK